MAQTFFDLEAVTPAGKPYPFSSHRGKVVLVVNTATQCGFTPQFRGLEALYQKYGAEGLAVVGFPCDQFDNQEPLTDDEMESVCRVNHGVTFPLMAKSDVNGPRTNPTFRYLKSQSKSLLGSNIPWNFTKFLVGRDGSVQRFPPKVEPSELEQEVVKLLAHKS